MDGRPVLAPPASGERAALARPRSQPLAVLLVGNFLSAARPGMCFVCEQLAGRLAAAGWSVTTTSGQPARLRRLADMLATIYRQRHHYAVAQVDVYSGPAFLWAEAAGWLLRRLDKPFLLTLHGGNLPQFSGRHPVRVRRLLRAAAAVTCPSPYLAAELKPFRDDLVLLPNGIDLARYPCRLPSAGLPQLVWLRAFHAIYNPPMAVQALHHLRQQGRRLRLLMIGPDKGDGSLRQTRDLAQQLGVAEQIEFRGGVSKANVPAELARGDVFLNTTRYDNSPVSVVEAMACGLPVVSTNVGGLPYLIRDRVTGLLVPAADAAAMAGAIQALAGDPGLVQTLSRNGRRAVEAFDWVQVLPQWEALFSEVAARSARAGR